MLDLVRIFEGKELIIVSIALLFSLIISFTLHEFAHAYIAYKQGDDTPKVYGRLTLNPFAHIDPIGFCCCLFFGFGWAKPVPVNTLNFKNYKKGLVLVSIAGVVVNLILAFIFGGLYRLCEVLITANTTYLGFFIYYFVYLMFSINACLFVFNLLPISPLDGYNFISAITKYDNKFVVFMRNYGFIILIILLLVFSWVLDVLINAITMPIYMFWSLFF